MAEISYRNAAYNAVGTIDCEIEHPVLGWIPFTASTDDPEEFGRTLFSLLSSSEDTAPYSATETGGDIV